VTAAVLYALSAIGSALVLPDRVPLHFALDGSADRYGSRAEAVIGFAALGLGMLALWLLVLQCLRRASLDLFHVPHAAYWKTPEREPELRRRVEVDLTWFFAATLLLLAAVPVSMAVAAGGGGRLPLGFQLLFGLFLVGTAVWCGLLAVRRYQPPA
jgi:hypothetical protein